MPVFKCDVIAEGQSQRAQNRTDRQTDRLTHKLRPKTPLLLLLDGDNKSYVYTT